MSQLVLIIDDDKDLRKSLKIGLERDGFAVVTAESAEMGKDVLKRIVPDAIVLDRMMHGMDGLTFLQQMRKSENKIPVLMLTAMNGTENTINGLAGGADDYLEKPFQLRELVLRLNNLLKRNQMPTKKMPNGLSFVDGDFYMEKRLISMSETAKSALREMLMGKTTEVSPMTAKRLRQKLDLANLKNLGIIAVRGKGYKLTNI